MPRTIDIDLLNPDVASFLAGLELPAFLERNGHAVGVVISPDACRQWQQRGDRLAAIMDAVGARNRDKNLDELEADIQEAIREVRMESP